MVPFIDKKKFLSQKTHLNRPKTGQIFQKKLKKKFLPKMIRKNCESNGIIFRELKFLSQRTHLNRPNVGQIFQKKKFLPKMIRKKF